MTSIHTSAPERAAPDTARLRFRGAVRNLAVDEREALFSRSLDRDATIRLRTQEIINRVRREGDGALFAMAQELDHVTLEQLEVPHASVRRALDRVGPAFRRALDRAADNIVSVHVAAMPQPIETSPEPGIIIGRRPDPLDRVGVYAPGGRAAYPSSVLMGAIPARIAGVGETLLCTPPTRDGSPSIALLAAAALADVDRVFAIGGAGAIAAMALGTSSVPRVDRIVGPGNAYVAEAKLQLAGVVGIDSPAGPSELLVIADDSSDPDIVARELLAQAEHDELTCVVAVAVGEATAAAIDDAIARQIAFAPRRAVVERALVDRGGVLTVDSLDEACDIANRYAAEHVLVALPSRERCDAVFLALRNVGTVFLGETSSNTFGDYMTGANHVLPTLGLARCYSGLSILDFFRWTTYQRVDRAAAARLAPDVAILADAEGLPGHARAARAWIDPQSVPGITTNAGLALSALVRPELAGLSTYSETISDTADSPPITLDLSDNTNLWGCPPVVAEALADPSTSVAAYPSPFSQSLKDALLRYLGLTSAGIVTGCGSDDVLDSAMRAFGSPGESIAYSTPTFSMIPRFARVNGLLPIEIPLRDTGGDYDIDAERLVATGAKLIYICAPNNPTGTPISRSALEHVVERTCGVIILDEAYAEFARSTNVDIVERSERVLVARTFSKAFGLAGLRIGYGVGAAKLIEFVERARGPYKVTAFAERAAFAVLNDDPRALGWVREHARRACENRDRFTVALQGLGFSPLPSAANFVLVPHRNALSIASFLRRRGILVRVMTGLPETVAAFAQDRGNALRIGIGPWVGMERILNLLAEVAL
jgi:histidinol dehydrogenase